MIAVGKRAFRDPKSVQGRDWQPGELWELLAGEDALNKELMALNFITDLGRNWAYKRHSWAAIEGCNFSVTNSPFIEFDETMVGWGFEDVDLAYGLTVVHGFSLTRMGAVVYDVQGFVNRAETWQQSDYIAHILNGFRFYRRWAHTGLTEESAIPRYTYDAETSLWSMGPIRERYSKPRVDVEFVRQWLTDRGYLPLQDDEPSDRQPPLP
jgi:hypothetical protein